MRNQYDKKFKEDAVIYYYEHKELGVAKCAEKLGTSTTALSTWIQVANEEGEVITRGSGNYASDEAKEMEKTERYAFGQRHTIHV